MLSSQYLLTVSLCHRVILAFWILLLCLLNGTLTEACFFPWHLLLNDVILSLCFLHFTDFILKLCVVWLSDWSYSNFFFFSNSCVSWIISQKQILAFLFLHVNNIVINSWWASLCGIIVLIIIRLFIWEWNRRICNGNVVSLTVSIPIHRTIKCF